MLVLSIEMYLIEFEVIHKGEESFHDHMVGVISNLIEVVLLARSEQMSGVVLKDFLDIRKSCLTVLLAISKQFHSLLENRSLL